MFFDKVEILSVVLFILAIFLMDVNLNIISAYGVETRVTVLNDLRLDSVSLFWLGFIASLFFFFLVSIRSLYKRQRHLTKFDITFGAIGVVGLMIILSGGILLFWHDNSLIIPFFVYRLTRVTYYHIGIGLSLISIVYFALTKN